ncbi:hypothetical protein Y695_04561 [Hydrogenophaga sp. T4]|nr:hypothetical protein Y695_04561 [Hydrogenophaga sp. T4]
MPQRVSLPLQGFCQKRDTMARSSNCWAMLMRACGGISNARSSSRPRRPVGESGENSLSMQNSLRCVLPVTSIRMLRSVRSTSQGGMSWPWVWRFFSISCSAISSS